MTIVQSSTEQIIMHIKINAKCKQYDLLNKNFSEVNVCKEIRSCQVESLNKIISKNTIELNFRIINKQIILTDIDN